MISPIQLYSVSNADARALIQAVRLEVEADHGEPVAAVVMDVTGRVLSSDCPDLVEEPFLDFARRKAYTVLKFNQATVEMRFRSSGQEWVNANGAEWTDFDLVTAMSGDPKLCAWAGGVPLITNPDGSPPKFGGGLIIGSLGISKRLELEDHDLACRAVARWLGTQ